MTSSFQIVDTHCHLEEPEFDADLDEVIRQAVRSGVYMITSAIREDTWERALGISRNHGSVSLALGLDPTRCYQVEPAQDFISANQKQLIALREVGFDHYRERDHKKREDQEKSFRLMIALAKEIGLPLQMHSRSAGRRALEILSNMEMERVQMHAFDGKASLARVASRENGYYFSIPTSVVRSAQKRKLVKAVDIERILVETDSPVLGPDRESRNEPINVRVVLREVVSILKREEEMRRIFLDNKEEGLSQYSEEGPNQGRECSHETECNQLRTGNDWCVQTLPPWRLKLSQSIDLNDVFQRNVKMGQEKVYASQYGISARPECF